ncbi:triphosphoribosyl-dephospho-CoA synthase [Bacillus seohaeanensis]|uniref:triphosphoribosyl-dephospho-CoA synthase n=1 Tax=Bacillus seohaeanensis TaxID=284580 RepID=A0ABW5RVQ2_9BACI
MKSEKELFSFILSKVAVNSLIEEVELTPKPGLVDRVNTGAHQDLTIELMRSSAESLAETFEQIAYVSYGRNPSQSLREEIAAIGRAGEKKMFEATNGVNTHKGAIWAMGLLVSAASIGKGMYSIDETVAIAGEIARFSDRYCPDSSTNGGNVRKRYGVGGAKAEAQQGFPHITQYALPMLYRSRASGLTEEKARLNALLSLIAHLDDTCILHRGGSKALSYAKKQTTTFLEFGNLDCLHVLNEDFSRRNISPGGSADLLAATLFLDRTQAERPVDEVRNDYEYSKLNGGV